MSESYVITPKSDLVSIADSIRSKTGSTDKINFSTLVENCNTAIESDGSGGSAVETCTVEIMTNSPAMESNLFFTNANMTVETATISKLDWMEGKTITVAKGTVLALALTTSYAYLEWNITDAATLLSQSIFSIDGDCSIVGVS